MSKADKLYGVLAEYDDARALLRAARTVRDAGYKNVDAYSPYPVHGLARAIGFERTRLPLLVLCGGIIGSAAGFGLQYWVSVIEYPLNIGGRPMNSWPSFMPVTFEVTVLVASLFAVLGMLGLNGLPRPHHPLFSIKSFDRVARDGFFLCVHTRDPRFDLTAVRELLSTTRPKEVLDVPDIK